MLKQMPKFVRIGRFLYLLRNIYLISKGKLLLKTETTGTKAYVLNTALVNRNKRALEPEDGSIILNDINSLIEYSLEFCKLVEGIEYKVNVFDDVYHNIENDKQLLNYNGSVLYVKISETAQQKDQLYGNKNTINNTTIKEETNDDIYYYPKSIARDWNSNNNIGIGNVISTDNGYVNSSRILYHNNNNNVNNTSSTYMIKKSNSDKSFDTIVPYCLKENDKKKKRVRLLLTNQNNKVTDVNHHKHKSNIHLSSTLHNRNNNNNNSSYYIKASFYPSTNTNEQCNSSKCSNHSFINEDECYYKYSSGTITLNNNNSKNKLQFSSVNTESISKILPIKHINYSRMINKNIKTNKAHSLRNNNNNNHKVDNTNYYTISDYNSKSNINSTSYIPTKLFPSRGRLVLPYLHKANSFQSISHNKHKRSNSMSYNTFKYKTPFVLNTTVQLNEHKLSKLNKVNIMKTILFSKQPLSNTTTTTHSINVINNIQLVNTKLKLIYTEFLSELRYHMLHNINTIISDDVISLIPSLKNSFQGIPSYQQVFPYKLCAKEFIIYSYLCYKCLQDNTTLDKVYNIFEHINEEDQNEITELIKMFKYEFEHLIRECHSNNYDSIIKYCMNNNTHSNSARVVNIHKGFFVLFVLCANYFDVFQYIFANIILQILSFNELMFITYENFSYYYLYFKCFDLLTNEQKHNVIKQLITSINNYNNTDIRTKMYTILNLDKKQLVNFLGNESPFNKYYKIDILYLNLINYFTYQQHI